MKHFIAALVGASALLLAGAATAADINGGSFKDGPDTQEYTGVNWSGLYIGGAAGYGIITETYEDSPVGLSFESPMLSAIAGFDIARGRWVFGPFAEYTYITADEADGISDWALGVRAGVLVNPRTLLYTSLAYAQLGNDDADVNGIRAGLGAEFAIGGGLFADLKANYTWYDLEDANDYLDAGDLRVLAGLKFKFNSNSLGLGN